MGRSLAAMPSMKTSAVILIAVVSAAAAVVGSAFVVRSGLLAIAAEIRDKPLPALPEQVTVSDLTIEHATITHQPASDGTAQGLTLTIENMRIDAPVNQQPE
jgi:hypothetical protein